MKTDVLVCLLCLAGCGADAKSDAVKQYAVNLKTNYADVVTQVMALETAVDAFVAAPTAEGLGAAQQAWLAARPIYGQSEVSRFYGGPIDAAQGGMNEWPIDENFIDYTAGDPTAGIINDPKDYPQIDAVVLATADEKGGIENLSTGFHAIEFLLWGQRPDQTSGPGMRPFTDYVDGGAMNADRRRTYLSTVTQMLVSDMQGLTATWDLEVAGSYGSQFVRNPDDGLANMVRGLSQMAISELLYERLSDPFMTKDRKDEESCFSESTRTDLIANALGVENVYLGRYVALDGTTVRGSSISDLVAAKDARLDAQLKSELTAIRDAISAIPDPFDQAVLSPVGSDGNTKVQAALDAFTPLQSSLEQMSSLLGVTNNL